MTPDREPFTSDVLQGSILKILINYLDVGLEESKLTDDTKLRGAVGSLEGREGLQRGTKERPGPAPTL